ncbi:hypothetical protein PG993_013527 [Apiospora rasikravindrae]|uniref:Chromo domain-containing protein n=1 Tax=Apiospora rasikravindrae TaxID=990691 RepID=A0ABR1RZA0_9PEZI
MADLQASAASSSSSSSGNQSATAESVSVGGMKYNTRSTRSKTATPSTAATPSIATYGFRVRKNASVPQANKDPVVPVVSRQSMRIAIANSLRTDGQHQLANPSAAVPNNAAAPANPATNLRRTVGRASASSTTRRITRSSKQPGVSMVPPRRAPMPIAGRHPRRGLPAAAAVDTGSHDTKRKTGHAHAKNMNQLQLDFSRGIPAEREGYYRIKNVVTEVTRGGASQYLVEWDGIDPSTGMAWPFEWVGASDLSKAALQAWELKKDELTG